MRSWPTPFVLWLFSSLLAAAQEAPLSEPVEAQDVPAQEAPLSEPVEAQDVPAQEAPLSEPVEAQDVPAQEPPVSEAVEAEGVLPVPTVADLRQLATGLGSESFEIRERSQASLAKYARQHPDAVRDALVKDCVSSPDPEVRYRLAQVLYDVVVEEKEHNGFLGIMMTPSNVLISGRIAPSIQVNDVIKDSAAAGAGLQPLDQIVQVDDVKFRPAPLNQPRGASAQGNMRRFMDYIAGRKRGTRVRLKIQRNGRQSEMLEVGVELGRRPRELMEEEELRATDQFFDNWLQQQAKDLKEPKQ